MSAGSGVSSPMPSADQHDPFVLRPDRIRLLLIVFCAASVLWIAFATWVVPPVIESAYRGESFSIVNGMIKGQQTYPVERYLKKWNGVMLTVLGTWVAFWLFAFVTSTSAFFRRFVGEATPGTLGAIRAWICFILLLSTFWEDLGSIALLPPEIRQPMGVMNLLHALPIGYEQFLMSETGLRLFQRLTEILLFLGLIGWRTRIVIPLTTIFAFVLNGILREYSGFWHQNLVPIYVLAVLSFTPCGDGWSVDRLRKILQGRAVPDADRPAAVYGWARYAVWVAIALPYLAAGLSKVRGAGLLWISPTNMRSMLYEQTLYPKKGDWSLSLYLTPAPDVVFVLLGIAAVAGELIFVAVLFSRLARRFIPAVTIGMHVGIILLQNIVFFDLILLPLVYYDFSKVRRAVGRWIAGGRLIEVLYDGLCPVCRRTVRLLRAVDFFGRLEFHDFRRLDPLQYGASRGLQLTTQDLEDQMYVVWRDRAYGGFYAYRVLARALPLLWPLVPLLFLPGISRLGIAAYAYVARNRFRLLKCDAHCPTDVAEERVAPTVASRPGGRNLMLRPSLAISTLAIVMLSLWFNRIETYPVTDMHMFSGVNSSVVTYFKILGHRESGVVSRAYFEDTVAAMSLNSRYEGLFDLCFGSDRDVEVCNKWLGALASAYNKKAAPGERMAAYEIQKWKWDFVAQPHGPDYGAMIEQFVYRVPADNDPNRSRR